MPDLLYTLAVYWRTVASVAGLVLLILGAAILARGRGVGPFADVTGLPARLMGLAATAVGAALWLH